MTASCFRCGRFHNLFSIARGLGRHLEDDTCNILPLNCGFRWGLRSTVVLATTVYVDLTVTSAEASVSLDRALKTEK